MKSNKQNTGRNSRGKGPRNQPSAGVLIHHTHPPAINPQIKHTQRMRFILTAAATNFDVNYNNVMNLIVMASTTTAGFQLFDQVKIRAVEIWAVGSSVTGGVTPPTTVAVAFSGNALGAVGSGRVYSDTAMGIEPAHVRAVPDKLSQTAQWQTNNGQTAFQFSGPIGSVIDVEVSYRNDDSAPSATGALVAAVAGEVYYRGLDGLAIATTTMVPQAQLTR